MPASSALPPIQVGSVASKHVRASDERADVLVAGSVALDLSCDYTAISAFKEKTSQDLRLQTSNPASIRQSIGGVGHNVALAAHRLRRPEARVGLCSLVGYDIAGTTILNTLQASGLDTSQVLQLKNPRARTAQYIAVNNGRKDLVVAMADMDIFVSCTHPAIADWAPVAIATCDPRWLVVDTNWSAPAVNHWATAARKHGARVALEPVSVAKAPRLFELRTSPLPVFPSHTFDLATPNQHELAALHAAAARTGHLGLRTPWFTVMDTLGISASSNMRAHFERIAWRNWTDAGVPVQALQLLPYLPTLLTKLGRDGVLMTQLMAHEDPRLKDPEHTDYVIARSAAKNEAGIGGVYMRRFTAAETVSDEEIVSVNGVGDTLGVLVAGLARTEGDLVDWAHLVNLAQRGAVLTLRSGEAVSERLGELKGEM